MIDLEKARATYSAGCAEDAANLVPDLIARIQELEDALVEERARGNRSGTGNILMSYLRDNNIDPEKYFSEKATEQLQAEGKIGPDADECPDDLPPIGSPYRSWQITEERKAAILHCKRMLTFLKEDDAPCYDVEKITKDESVLVAMLEEAGQ